VESNGADAPEVRVGKADKPTWSGPNGEGLVRLRMRGVATNEFATILGLGGKSSGHGLANWIKATYGDDARLLGFRRVVKEGAVSGAIFAQLSFEDVEVCVCVDVLSRLLAFTSLRPRTAELLMTLRSKALALFKELDIDSADTSLSIPGTLAMAMRLTVPEIDGAMVLSTPELFEEESILRDASVGAVTVRQSLLSRVASGVLSVADSALLGIPSGCAAVVRGPSLTQCLDKS